MNGKMEISKKWLWAFLGLVLLAIIVSAVVAPKGEPKTNSSNTSGSNTSSPTSKSKAAAKFKANIIDSTVVNPSTLRFSAEVTNNGDSPGKPSCKVSAKDESLTYKGFDTFDIDELKAGQSENFNGMLTITKEGASFISKIDISCTSH